MEKKVMINLNSRSGRKYIIIVVDDLPVDDYINSVGSRHEKKQLNV